MARGLDMQEPKTREGVQEKSNEDRLEEMEVALGKIKMDLKRCLKILFGEG